MSPIDKNIYIYIYCIALLPIILCIYNYMAREYIQQPFHRHSISIMCDASWINSFSPCGLGFIIIANNNYIILVGALPSTEESSLHAELAPLEEALHHCRDRSLNPNHIFCDCQELLEFFFCCHDSNLIWRFHGVHRVKNLLGCNLDTDLEYIPRDLNSVADALANFGRMNPARTLFHKGLDLPRWLMELVADAGLSF